MPRYKFDDCKSCRFRKRPSVCANCDFGEYYEDADIPELRFDDSAAVFSRSNKSLVTDDDEPDLNPDDLIERLSQEPDEDEDQDEEL